MTTNIKDKMKEVAMEIGQAETYRALICPTCKGGKTLLKKVQGKGCYEVVLDICDKCHGTGEIEITNEEYIRSCTTEQLAECIIGIDYGTDDKDTKIAKLVEWLNQPHTFIDY